MIPEGNFNPSQIKTLNSDSIFYILTMSRAVLFIKDRKTEEKGSGKSFT